MVLYNNSRLWLFVKREHVHHQTHFSDLQVSHFWHIWGQAPNLNRPKQYKLFLNHARVPPWSFLLKSTVSPSSDWTFSAAVKIPANIWERSYHRSVDVIPFCCFNLYCLHRLTKLSVPPPGQWLDTYWIKTCSCPDLNPMQRTRRNYRWLPGCLASD